VVAVIRIELTSIPSGVISARWFRPDTNNYYLWHTWFPQFT
jgi:hypothetical protein